MKSIILGICLNSVYACIAKHGKAMSFFCHAVDNAWLPKKFFGEYFGNCAFVTRSKV